MTEYKEAAFMADLLLGTQNHIALDCELDQQHQEALSADAEHLAQVVDRVRAQTLHITHSLREWTTRHRELQHPIKRRYSAYEGMLCRQDLRQHMILYRHALRDYLRVRKLCNQNASRAAAPASRKLGKSNAA